MDLRNYLNSLETDQQHAFAAASGTTLGYLRKALSLGQRFDAKLAIELAKNSGGTVGYEALRPDIDWSYVKDGSRNAAPQ